MDLHPHEIRLLKAMDCEMSPETAAEKSGLNIDAVARASSWLATKELVEVTTVVAEVVKLGAEGGEYVEKGLPERQLLEIIGNGMPMADLKKKSPPELFGIGFGWLRKKAMIQVDGGDVKPLNTKETLDEKFLKTLAEKKKLYVKDLDPGFQKALQDLKGRQNVIQISEEKTITLKPTKKGLQLSKKVEVDERVGELTPEIIKNGAWKEKGFRPYQVDVYQKPSYPVRVHPLTREIRRIKQIFVNMGFREIEGPLIETAFWNFDALFQPQDHPARDMHDTFYLDGKNVKPHDYSKFKDAVAKAHEDGGDTGSTGWKYKWSEEVARKMLLRTHTTAVTARELSKAKPQDMPIKVFSIGKVFRNEAVDYKHLPEFYQVEGIVADPSVTFRNLLGILREFYDEMGFDKIRFRPGYFPYTEMSVEPEVYFEEKGEWIELGGAGIFRPEVVKPLLGVDVPVLAWGLGLDRVVSLKLGLKDLRQLYISDLDWLKQN
ncbi:MAG TPA: phenylalanine--tRNA ligase subunit alpha [Candidatus Altiarchaeales archaeon]|nr:phenylalanine--tRNA ligase subunit alpha [Candidatus Altiarchaeales archaeon]